MRSKQFFNLIYCLIIFLAGCSSSFEAEGQAKTVYPPKKETVLKDSNVLSFQLKLLDFAYEAASTYPIVPHIKNRSRAQEKVVLAALELNLPNKAYKYIEGIQNWRKAKCLARLAHYYIEQGKVEQAKEFLKTAETISQQEDLDPFRSNEIKEIIFDAYALIGDPDQAQNIVDTMVDLNSEQADAMKIKDEDSFVERIKVLDSLIKKENYELWKYALYQYVNLFKKFYNDNAKRMIAEEKIKSSLERMPLLIRIEVFNDLVLFALEHSDKAEALKMVNNSQQVLDSSQWEVDQYVALKANIARLRFLCGDKEKAKEQLDEALSLFNEHVNNIRDYKRAKALREVAFSYQTMKEQKKAYQVYKKAVNQGFINPNIKPRTDDLTATCVSMALSGINPDQNLWKLMTDVKKQLGKEPRRL